MSKKRDIYNETEDPDDYEDIPSEQDTYPPESEEEESETASDIESVEDTDEDEDENSEYYADGIYENEEGDHFFIKDGLVFDSDGQILTQEKSTKRKH